MAHRYVACLGLAQLGALRPQSSYPSAPTAHPHSSTLRATLSFAASGRIELNKCSPRIRVPSPRTGIRAGWLAGLCCIRKQDLSSADTSLYLKMIRLISITGWLASWLGWLAGRCGLAGWLLSVAVGWLTGCGWLAGWLAGSLWLPGWLASCFYQDELGAAGRR